MAHFMPMDQEKANNLNNQLSQTVFRSVEDFVTFYNSGLINKRHDDVSKYVKEISSTYQDVKEKNNKLIFLSENEIILTNIKKTLEYWNSIVKIKREIDNLLNEKILKNDDIIGLSIEAEGYLLKKEEDNSLIKISQEKLYSNFNDLITCYNKYSSVKDDEAFSQNILFFKPSDILNIDDSFIKNISQQIPKK